jgi:hypothetical protein
MAAGRARCHLVIPIDVPLLLASEALRDANRPLFLHQKLHLCGSVVAGAAGVSNSFKQA